MIVKLNRPRLAVKGACFLFYFHVETWALEFARFGIGQKWLCVYVLFDCVIIGEAKKNK